MSQSSLWINFVTESVTFEEKPTFWQWQSSLFPAKNPEFAIRRSQPTTKKNAQIPKNCAMRLTDRPQVSIMYGKINNFDAMKSVSKLSRNRSRHLLVAACAGLLLSTVRTRALDDDLDGVSDVFLATFGLSSSEAADDQDGDGYSTRDEAAFGTNPLERESAPVISWTTHEEQRAIQWRTIPGIRYQLMRSSNLVDWTPSGSEYTGTGGTRIIVYPNSPKRRFVKLETRGSRDSDGDGLSAFEEFLLGTSDAAVDSDGDNLGDALEFRSGFDPSDASSSDGEPIADDWEVYHFGGTHLTESSDTDADGFSLLEEFRFNLNPSADDFATTVTHIFSHDAKGRLTRVSSAISESFSYDEEGNIISTQ